MHNNVLDQLKHRLAEIESRLAAACARAGRARTEVTLLAVTKTVSVELAQHIQTLGIGDLGENRPQELWRKAAQLSGVRWHLIGHLQRNKIERTLPLVTCIHSVDSWRLLEALEKEAERQQRHVSVFLEVNASGEASKTGMPVGQLAEIVVQAGSLKRVRISGLMTMAAYEEDPEKCRPTFTALRQLRDRWRHELPPPHALEQLSMGMSNDFEIAVEEGSTCVRLGSVLFAGLEQTA